MPDTTDTNRAHLASVPNSADADEEPSPSVFTALPRLGRGIVWADVLADMERDNVRSEAA